MGFRDMVMSRCKGATHTVVARPGKPKAPLTAASRAPERRKFKAARSTARNNDVPSYPLTDDSSLYGQTTEAAYEESVETVPTSPKGGQLTQATLEQEQMAQVMYARLLSVMHDQDSQGDFEGFDAALQNAANADLLSVWPFRGSLDTTTNLVSCKYNIGDLIHAASATQRLWHMLPHLEALLATARVISVGNSPCLEDTIELLAEAYDLPGTPPDVKGRIARIMNHWSLMRIPVDNSITVWSDEPQPGRMGSRRKDVVIMGVGRLTQHRPYSSDLSPTAAVQPSSPPPSFSSSPSASPQALQPAELALDAPQEIAANELITKAEAAKAVAEAVSREKEHWEKVHKRSMQRPNDKFMVRNYCRRHTNFFHRDFNGDMLKKRRQKLEAEQANLQPPPPPDVCIFNSILASVDDGDDGYI